MTFNPGFSFRSCVPRAEVLVPGIGPFPGFGYTHMERDSVGYELHLKVFHAMTYCYLSAGSEFTFWSGLFILTFS